MSFKPMTPEQKRELAQRLVELKEANNKWYLQECERRKLNEPGDANSEKYKMREKQILLDHLERMYRLSRITYINQYRESNGQA